MATVIKYHNYYKTNSGNIEIRSSRNYCVLLADPLKKEKTKKKKKKTFNLSEIGVLSKTSVEEVLNLKFFIFLIYFFFL